MNKKIILMLFVTSLSMLSVLTLNEMIFSKALLTSLAFAFGSVPFITYAMSIYQHHKTGKGTLPTRVTLLIWAFLDVVMFITYLKENGWNTMTYMLLAYMIGALSVSYMALKYGTWGLTRKERRDSFIVLFGASVGISAWLFYNSALLGHYLFIATLSISVLPLIKKIYQKPWTEDFQSWIMWFIANNFTLVSIFFIDGWNIENGLLTVVYFILYIILLFPMVRFWIDKNFLEDKLFSLEDQKNGILLKRLTKVARHINAIEKDEELRKVSLFGQTAIRTIDNSVHLWKIFKTKK